MNLAPEKRQESKQQGSKRQDISKKDVKVDQLASCKICCLSEGGLEILILPPPPSDCSD